MSEKLEKENDPLEQAIKFLRPLENFAKNRIETYLMAFEIHFRRRKFLLMLQSLKRAHSLNPSHPDLHACVVRFWHMLNQNLDNLDSVLKEVIYSETRKLFNNIGDVVQFNNNYLEENGDNLIAVLKGAKMLYYLNPNLQSEAIELVTKLDSYQNVDIEICNKVLESLKMEEFGQCDSQIEQFKANCRSRFLHAVDFL